MIAELLRQLADLGLHPEPDELRDALWLARLLPKPETHRVPPPGPNDRPKPPEPDPQRKTPEQPPPTGAQAPPKQKPPELPVDPEKPQEKAAEIRQPLPQQSVGRDQGLPFRTPTASALPGAAAIARALRPLRQKRPERGALEFDEERTIEESILQRSFVPVQKAPVRQWLDVVLVVDGANSMVVWHRTLMEFRQLLERTAAFRRVHVWTLQTGSNAARLSVVQGAFGKESKRAQNANLLADATGQRLILYATDGVSSSWRDGRVAQVLQAWAHTTPVAILSVLPRDLLRVTALSDVPTVRIRAPMAGARNTELQWSTAEPRGRKRPVGLPVPLLFLEKTSAIAFANLLVAKPGHSALGLLLPTSANAPVSTRPAGPVSRANVDAKARVRHFDSFASPTARRLAALYTTIPLSVPVMHLVRETMLPKAGLAQMAEVFLGGILREMVGADQAGADGVRFDFHEGVREELSLRVLRTDTISVLHHITQYVAEHLGESLDFAALLTGEESDTTKVESPMGRAFAKIAADRLRAFGGEYEKMADRLVGSARSLPVNEELDRLARKYEELRANLPFGLERTRAMDDVVSRVVRIGIKAKFQPADVIKRFERGTPGDRVVALGLILANPQAIYCDVVVRSVRERVSAFEQSSALRVVEKLVRLLPWDGLVLLDSTLRTGIDQGDFGTKRESLEMTLANALIDRLDGIFRDSKLATPLRDDDWPKMLNTRWEALEQARPTLAHVIPAVGRLELEDGSWFGTAFVVGEDLIGCPAFALEEQIKRQSGRIYVRLAKHRLGLDLASMYRLGHTGSAVVRVPGLAGAGYRPIALSSEQATVGAAVVVVAHLKWNSLEREFEGISRNFSDVPDGSKWLLPGEVLALDVEHGDTRFDLGTFVEAKIPWFEETYGAPIVDLQSGAMIGIAARQANGGNTLVLPAPEIARQLRMMSSDKPRIPSDPESGKKPRNSDALWVEFILDRIGNEVPVRVRGSRGEEFGPRLLGIGVDRLQAFTDRVARAARKGTQMDGATLENAQEIRKALFAGDAESLFARMRDASTEPLLLRFMVHDRALQAVPWEALCEPATYGLLGTAAEFLPVRGVATSEPWVPREIRSTVKIMAIAPMDRVYLDTLRYALAASIDDGEVEWLEPITGSAASMRHIFDRLGRESGVHIVHFVGHGDIDSSGRPVLRVADDDDEEKWIPAEVLAAQLSHDLYTTLRLVVLECSDGAKPSAFGSAAEILVRAGADAVVAFQWTVRANVAHAFCSAFYRALTDAQSQGDVALAVNEARRSVLASEDASTEMLSAVLYLRGPNGKIFDFTRRRPIPPMAMAPDKTPERSVPPSLQNIVNKPFSLVLGDGWKPERAMLDGLRDKLATELAKRGDTISEGTSLATVAQRYALQFGTEKLGGEFQRMVRRQSESSAAMLDPLARLLRPGVHVSLLRQPWLERSLAEAQPARTIYVAQLNEDGVLMFVRGPGTDAWEEAPEMHSRWNSENDFLVLRLFGGYTVDDYFSHPTLTEDDYQSHLPQLWYRKRLPANLVDAIHRVLMTCPALLIGLSLLETPHRTLLKTIFERGVPHNSVAVVDPQSKERQMWATGRGLPSGSERIEAIEASTEDLDAYLKALNDDRERPSGDPRSH